MSCQIDLNTILTSAMTSPEVPGAHFDIPNINPADVREALAIESAIAAFEQDGDDCILFEDLSALGFEPGEIRAIIANPAVRPATLYMAL
jgi:hypothetical protein